MAMKEAKRSLLSSKVLAHFDPKLPIRLASSYGEAIPYGARWQ